MSFEGFVNCEADVLVVRMTVLSNNSMREDFVWFYLIQTDPSDGRTADSRRDQGVQFLSQPA